MSDVQILFEFLKIVAAFSAVFVFYLHRQQKIDERKLMSLKEALKSLERTDYTTQLPIITEQAVTYLYDTQASIAYLNSLLDSFFTNITEIESHLLMYFPRVQEQYKILCLPHTTKLTEQLTDLLLQFEIKRLNNILRRQGIDKQIPRKEISIAETFEEIVNTISNHRSSLSKIKEMLISEARELEAPFLGRSIAQLKYQLNSLRDWYLNH